MVFPWIFGTCFSMEKGKAVEGGGGDQGALNLRGFGVQELIEIVFLCPLFAESFALARCG